MTEAKLDFSKFEKADPYVPVDLKILGRKEVTAKKGPNAGTTYQVLVCADDAANEVSLFDWALCERNGKPFVLAKHLKTALDRAKTRN